MSLLIWLPLNGDLTQQGLSNVTFSYINNNSGISVNNSGKIGKCYERTANAENDLIRSSSTINLNNDLSMCCWAYVSETIGDTANGLISNHSHADNTGVGITVKQVSTSDYRISCSTGTGSNRTFCTYYGITNIKNTWHHLALTYNKSTKQLLLYVDGKVEYTLNNYVNASKADYIDIFNWSTTNSTHKNYRPECRLNDVRIYDHCLSPKEVKEISKGLVLHYKLSDPLENLLGSNCLNERTINRTSSNNSIDYNYNSKILSLPSLTFTVNFDAKTLGTSSKIDIYFRNSNGTSYAVTPTLIITDLNYKRYSLLLTGNPANLDIFRFRLYANTDSITVKNVKLETGSIPTPWIPPTTEPLYSILGYNNGIEYDCSGFGYNGTKTGDIQAISDSKRYNTSYKLLTGAIIGPIPNILKPTPEITMSIWVKLYTERTSGELTLFNNFERGGCGLTINKTNYRMLIYSDGYLSAETDMTGKMTLWHHFAGTADGTNIKLYIDGELLSTKAINANSTITYLVKTPWSIGINPGPTGGTGGMVGQVSDARIYATALSAEDIKELYNTSAAIDNNGNAYARELVE